MSEQVSASQTLDDASSKEVINQISTVAQGAHPLSRTTDNSISSAGYSNRNFRNSQSDAATVVGGNSSYLIL